MTEIVEALLALLAYERQQRMRNELFIDGLLQRTGEEKLRLHDRIGSLELRLQLCETNHTDQPTPWAPVPVLEEASPTA